MPTVPCAPWHVQLSSPPPRTPTPALPPAERELSVRPLLGFTRMASRGAAHPPWPHSRINQSPPPCSSAHAATPSPPTGPSVQSSATSPRIIYAALTRYGPPVPSMSSATAAQRAHAALQAPGGHGMAAANRPAFSAACAGEKIPENPGCLPTNLDPRNKQSTSHNISRNQELVVSRADEGHFPWFQHGRNHGKDHRQE